MGTVKTLKGKLVVMLIVFMMLFSNFGFTISALAANDEFEVINNWFFKKDEIKFDAYFEDEDGNKLTVANKDVNENIKLVLEIFPQVEGFLKEGKIEAVSADGSELGFKFASVSQNLLESTKTETNILDAFSGVEADKEEAKEEVVESEDDVAGVDNAAKEEVVENDATEKEDNTNNNAIQSILDKVSDGIVKVDGNNMKSESNPLASILNAFGEEIFVEDSVIAKDEEADEKTVKDSMVNALYDIAILSDSEISLANIVEDTKIEVELEYIHDDIINVNDLLEDIKLQLSGTFINKNLKEVKVGKEKEVTVGWDYSKDIAVSSEFSKFSPFAVLDVKGTIVQNDITISRIVEEEKYLPLKSTTIEVDVPKINDEAPIEINVVANKTKATNGEDVGETTFTKSNWSYDKESGKITIKVVNKDGNTAVNSFGQDEYVIIYRFKDYVESESYILDNNVTVKAVEYSSDSETITKVINETKEVAVKKDELLTSSVGTTEDKISKANINANYNSGNVMYETEYKSLISVNILTSDILENVIIDTTNDNFKGSQGLDFKIQDVRVKRVRFNFVQIQEILSAGGEIIIRDSNNEILHVLNKEVVKEEKDCSLRFNNVNGGLFIELNNIRRNGTIDFELTKAIGRSTLDRRIFKDVTHIESYVGMSLKYLGMNERVELMPMAAQKEFEESETSANLLVSKKTFSVTKTNGNVEFKIELNNDKLTSDLYANPSFEIALPIYVTDVKLNSVNMLHGEEFAIEDFSLYKAADNTMRIKVDLSGVQTKFATSEITNGTNIIINADVDVSEYAPAKEDYIKLYYCNESVARYQTQANWNMSKHVPDNCLSDKNGYDVTAIRYDAPSGMIAVNSIKNYDGTGNIIKSFNQGEVTKVVPTKGDARIATMELAVVNNTDTDAEEMVLIGRVPFEGNKDVETGEDLGTNVTTAMKSLVVPADFNSNEVTVYYSSNPNADRDLNNEANGWNTSFAPIENVKSFMIVVNNTFKAGSVLKFEYNFEIPANLGYEVKILGSFGAFYNSIDNNLTLYKSEIADKVGLVTEEGVKYEATMSVDIGDGKDIGESKYLIYTVKVTNTGSIDLKNVRIQNEMPNLGTIQDKTKVENGVGIFYIDELLVGETKKVDIEVKTSKIPKDLATYAKTFKNMREEMDENGNPKYYTLDANNKKQYITKLPDEFYIENYATVYAENTQKGIKTNTVKNKLVPSYLDIVVDHLDTNVQFKPGDEIKYLMDVYNQSDETIENIVVENVMPKELKYLKFEQVDTEYEDVFDPEKNTLTVSVGNLEPLKTARFFVYCEISIQNVGKTVVGNSLCVTADNDIKEYSNVHKLAFRGPELTVIQETNAEDNTVFEMEKFELLVNINNKGEAESQKLDFKIEIPSGIEILDITSEGKRMINFSEENNIITGNLFTLEAQDDASLIITARAKPLHEEESNAVYNIDTTIIEAYIGELDVNELKVIVLDKPDRDLTDEEKKEEEEKDTVINPEAGDDYKQDIHNNNTNNSNNNTNNSNDVNNSNNSNNTNNTDNTNNSNNSNNSNNTNNLNNNTNKPANNSSSNNTERPIEQDRTYKITGKVWDDTNKNNIKDSNEDGVQKVHVTLYEGSTKLLTVLTDSLGKYRFTEVKEGNYTVVFEYNGNKYVAAQYKLSNVSENENSDAIETQDGVAVTDNILINKSDLEIDLGLQTRDVFDIAVHKYVSKAIVNTNGKEKVENYDNEEVAKLEIRSKELKNTKIKLEYKIVVTNEGDVDGKVGKVIDYLPKTLTFDKDENSGWSLDSNGLLSNDMLEDMTIKPGESKELKLVLNKVMTEDNTGTISNKVEIQDVSNSKDQIENAENNISTQEMIITVSTGRTISIVVLIIALIATSVLVYRIKTGKIKRIYK